MALVQLLCDEDQLMMMMNKKTKHSKKHISMQEEEEEGDSRVRRAKRSSLATVMFSSTPNHSAGCAASMNEEAHKCSSFEHFPHKRSAGKAKKRAAIKSVPLDMNSTSVRSLYQLQISLLGPQHSGKTTLLG